MTEQIARSADATTLTLNGRTINDVKAGDAFTLTPANEKTSRINSADGGVTIFERLDGDVADLEMRIQQGSEDDRWLNGQMRQSPPVIFNGSMKTTYIVDGNEFTETWVLEGGSITSKPTDTVNNQDGNDELTYTIQFRRAKRAL